MKLSLQAMVFNEAPGHHKPLPPGFPTCEDFALTDQQSEDYDRGAVRMVTRPLLLLVCQVRRVLGESVRRRNLEVYEVVILRVL